MNKEIAVKIILLKFGKILLQKGRCAWGLVNTNINANEALPNALQREIYNSCGWQTKNIRLLRINLFEEDNKGEFELVFIVEADKRSSQDEKSNIAQKWFTIDDIMKLSDIDSEDFESIKALQGLVFKGKTVELDLLPPVFDLRKQKKTRAIDLISLPT